MSRRERGGTLVLCVDRDNDIGEKAGLQTPVVGRAASLSAATKLGLADAEDSDVNAIFAAVRIYEWLKGEGNGAGAGDVEIALVAGEKNLGVEADRKVGRELDEVLSKTGAETAILVSDGAEDESILPILQSRVKIDAVRRVVVRQSEPLESSFYVVKKLLEDPKFAHTFLTPLGLIFISLFISLLVGQPGWAVGLIFGFVGIYLLLKSFGLENLMMEFLETVRQSIYSGKISLVTYICAVVLLLAGTSQGITEYTKLPTAESGERILLSFVYFARGAVGWYVGAALAPLVGKMLNMLIERERIVRQWAILFSVVASGLIVWGGSECIILLSEGNYPMGYQFLFFSLLGATVLSLVGVRISLYLKERSTMSKGEGKES